MGFVIGLWSLWIWEELSFWFDLIFIWVAKSSSYLFCSSFLLIFSYWSYYRWFIWYYATFWLYIFLCSISNDFLLSFSYIWFCKKVRSISFYFIALTILSYWIRVCSLANYYCSFLTKSCIALYFYWTWGAVLSWYTFWSRFWLSMNWL